MAAHSFLATCLGAVVAITLLGARDAAAEKMYFFGLRRSCDVDKQLSQRLEQQLLTNGISMRKVAANDDLDLSRCIAESCAAEVRRGMGLRDGQLFGGQIEERSIRRDTGERELWLFVRLWLMDLASANLATLDHPFLVGEISREDVDWSARRGAVEAGITNLALRLLEQPSSRFDATVPRRGGPPELCVASLPAHGYQVPRQTHERVTVVVEAGAATRKSRGAVLEEVKRHLQETGRTVLEEESLPAGRAAGTLRIQLQPEGQVQLALLGTKGGQQAELDCLGCAIDELTRRVVQAAGALMDRASARTVAAVPLIFSREVCESWSFDQCGEGSAVSQLDQLEARYRAQRLAASASWSRPPVRTASPTAREWLAGLSSERKIAASVLGGVSLALLVSAITVPLATQNAPWCQPNGCLGPTERGVAGGVLGGLSAGFAAAVGLTLAIPPRKAEQAKWVQR